MLTGRRSIWSLPLLMAAVLTGLAVFFFHDAPPAAAQAPHTLLSVTVQPGHQKLDVTWVPRTSGGTPTGYDVHYTASATVGGSAAVGSDVDMEWVDASHSGTTTSASITGLTNDEQYRVRVRATNNDGDGGWKHAGNGNFFTPLPTITLTSDASNGMVTEGDAALTLTATLSAAADQDGVTVTVARASNSTAASSDIGSIGSITIASGDTAGTTSLSIVDDDVDEDDETLVLSTSATKHIEAGGASGRLSLTIKDNDDAGVTVSQSTRTVEVGETTTYTVKLDTQPTSTVTITPTSSDTGKATVSGAMSFTGGSSGNWNTPQTVTVTGRGTGTLNVTHAVTGGSDAKYPTSMSISQVGVTVSASTKTLRITQTAQASEGGNAELTVTLGRAPTDTAGHTVNVNYGYSGSSTATAADTGTTPSTVTVAQNATTATLTVPIAQDALVEGAETFTVTISTTASGWNPASTGANVATITIIDDEAANARIAFGSNAAATAAYTASADEDVTGGTLTVPVTISALPQSSARFDVEVVSSGATATETQDYRIGTKSVTFGNTGNLTKNVSVALTNDAFVENDETIKLKIKARPTQHLVGNFHGTTVFLVTTVGQVFTQGFTTGNGATGFTLTSIEANLQSGANAAQAATFRAELWSDASNQPSSKLADLTVPATWSPGIVSFAAPSSVVLSANTTYHLVLYTVGSYNAQISVTSSQAEDTGGQPGWSIADVPRWVNSNQPTGTWWSNYANNILLRVNGFEHPSSGDLGGHYARNASSSTATLTIEDDEVDVAKIAFGTDAAGTAKYTRSHNETASATVRVTVSHLPDADTTFTVETVTSGAGAGTASEQASAMGSGDFHIADKPVTFGRTGSKYRDVAIAFNNDSLVEDDQTIELRIVAADAAPNDLGDYYARHADGSQARVTIVDDEAPQAKIAFGPNASATAKITESPLETAGTLTVPITVSALPEEESDFTVSVSGTATKDTDYSLSAETFTFNSASALTQNLTITLTNDMLVEEDQTIELEIASGDGFFSKYARHAQGKLAEVTIKDDERPDAKIAIGPSAASTTKHTKSGAEGDGTLTVPITISHLPESSTTFAVEVLSSGTTARDSDDANNAAGNPKDYDFVSKEVTFTSTGDKSMDLTVNIADDNVEEDDETIQLRIVRSDNPKDDLGDHYVRHADGSASTLTLTSEDAVSTVTLKTNVASLPGGVFPAYEGGRLEMTVTADIPVGPGGWTVEVKRAPTDLYLKGEMVFRPYCEGNRHDLTVGYACPNDVTLPSAFTIREGQTEATGYLSIRRDNTVEATQERLSVHANASRKGVTRTSNTLNLYLRDAGTGIILSETALDGLLATDTATYTVALSGDTAPTANVTVTPASSATDKATVSGALTFTPENYAEPQEVTVTAVAAGTATITHTSTSTDARYSLSSSVLGRVKVTVSEPENSYRISPVATAAEGETAELTVTLGARAPSTDNPNFTVDRSRRHNEEKLQGDAFAHSQDDALADVSTDLGASPPSTLTVTVGERTATLSDPIAEDDLVEGDEHYYVVISTTETGWEPAEGNRPSHPAASRTCAQNDVCARVTITDPDAADAKIAFGSAAGTTAVHTASVGEGAGTLTVPVTITARPKSSTTFNIEVVSSGATATEGSDYSIATKSVTFGPSDGDLTENVTITITGDTDAEGDETIQLRIAAADTPVNDLGDHYQRDPNGSRATLTITDDDGAVAVSTTALPVKPGEAAEYTIVLRGATPSSNVTITPTSGDTDKATVSGALTFTPGNYQQAQTVTVTGVAEGSATITHAISGGGSAYSSLSVADVAVTVAAVATATLSVSPNPVPEGGTVTVTIDLSEAVEEAAVIPIVLTPGTAEAGDYGTLANIPIRAGSLRFTGRIRTNQDTDSDDETFTVALGALPAGVGAGSTSSVEVTIADDDVARVTLSVSPNPVLEGHSVTVTARLNRTLPGAVAVPLTLSDGTAESGDHGSLASITIPARRGSATGEITTAQDAGTDDETFTVSLGALPAGVKEGTTRTVEITITDDDARVSLSASPNPVVEGRSVTITATLSRPASRAVTVPVTVTTGTAEAGDLSALTGIRVARGRVSGTASIATRQDADTDDETFTVTLDTANLPDTLLTGATTSVDITIDDDDTPRVSLSASPRRVAEGESVTVTAKLSAALANDVTIPLTLTDGTADSGDYGSLASITITAGGTSATGVVTTAQDDDTDDETFTVALDTANLPGTLLAGSPSSVQITITDDDAGVTLSASPTQVAEGRSVTVTARLNRRLTGDVTVPLTLTRGTAESGDYGALAGITITAGRTSATGVVTTAQDDDTDDETFTVALGALPATVKQGATTSMEITIVDDDARVSLSASPNPVAEGGTVTVTATLSRAASRSVAVPITVTTGTAEAGDLGTLTGIRVSRGSVSGTGRIATRQDDDTDDETFTVAIDTANLPETLLAGGTTSASITIDDDDTPTVNLSASSGWVMAGESVTIKAKLSAALPGDVTIPLTLTPEWGTGSDDYGTLSSIRIAAGATSGTGTITTRKDADPDYERFRVSLGNLPAVVQQGTRKSLLMTIAPADIPTVWLTTAKKTVAEGESATVAVWLTAALNKDVTIPLKAAFNHGTATGYEVTIAAGQTSATGDIPTEQDADTNNETLIVEIDDTRVPLEVNVRLYSSEYPNDVVIRVLDDDAD